MIKKLRRSMLAMLLCCTLVGGVWLAGPAPHAQETRAIPSVLPTAPGQPDGAQPAMAEDGGIRWVDFNVPATALQKAYEADVDSHKAGGSLRWVDVLAILATRYGGNWNLYSAPEMDALITSLEGGATPEKLMEGYRYYDYYQRAYTAILGSYVGSYQKEVPDKLSPGQKRVTEGYGLLTYHPIAEGFGYNDYDDFGNARSYGYHRTHLGHDLMGGVGTPVCAVEAGTVEDMGWNQYGGWQVGIRSLDGERYYYYAHLQRDTPYHIDLEPGRLVKSGEVIGYLGMTGYSPTPNVSNMKAPHLHLGMQLIFDPSQEEGPNEIWIDLYPLTTFLAQNRATVDRDAESGQYYRRYDIFDPLVEAYITEHPQSRK